MAVSAALRATLLDALSRAEARLDTVKHRVAEERTPVLHAYRGFATDTHLFLRGRVLQDPGLTSDEPTDRMVENALNMLRRFESDEIPGATVQAEIAGQSCTAVSDEEGYFEIDLTLDRPLPEDRSLHEVRLTLLGTRRNPDARATCTGDVVTVPTGARFGVISDVDDTVLQTGATSFVKMFTTTLLSNAHTRLPFEGVAAFYRALAFGTGTTADNPVFYVSSSPWNLYDLLTEFMDVQGLPRGPLFLRDLGLTKDHLVKSGHGDHKLAAIERLLAAYPHLPFVLLGDSGQHDPEIYTEAVQHFPGRIKAVYLRDVTADVRDEAVRALAATLEAAGVPVCYAETSLDAARHAVRIGLIDEKRLVDVAAEAAKDADPAAPAPAPTDTAEQAPGTAQAIAEDVTGTSGDRATEAAARDTDA